MRRPSPLVALPLLAVSGAVAAGVSPLAAMVLLAKFVAAYAVALLLFLALSLAVGCVVGSLAWLLDSHCPEDS